MSYAICKRTGEQETLVEVFSDPILTCRVADALAQVCEGFAEVYVRPATNLDRAKIADREMGVA
jgi:hypothetical protein